MIATRQEPQAARRVQAVRPGPRLLRLQHDDPVPVGGRRVVLENTNAVGIKVEQMREAETLAELAAAFDRLRRAGKIALPKPREQIVDVPAQLAKTVAARDLR